MNRRISCILLGLLLLTSAASAQDSSTPTPQYYTVVQGDTLISIALRYHTTTAALIRANGIVNANRLSIGENLIIPGDEATAPAPAGRNTPVPTATASEAP